MTDPVDIIVDYFQCEFASIYGFFYLCSAVYLIDYYQLMSKNLCLLVIVACILSLAVTDSTNSNTYSMPVDIPAGKTSITLFDVWPKIDVILKQNYWFYLRGANALYEASVNSPTQFLFFTIYRNIVGTFLVITTWTKSTQVAQVNTFVRLGDGYDPSSGAHYDPVKIDPLVVSLQLAPNEYMVEVNADGTLSVTGNMELYNQDTSSPNNGDGKDKTAAFNITADMEQKCKLADKYNRDTYWNYLSESDLVSESDIPTSTQYYCVFIYVNVVGTFLSISNYDLATKTVGINTLVRLGNGKAPGANYGPVSLSPAILEMKSFN